VIIHHRTGFAASMIDGRTVMEVAGDERSATEIMQLWDYIGRRISRDFRTMLPSGMFSQEPDKAVAGSSGAA
jgi:chromosome partitioning protein